MEKDQIHEDLASIRNIMERSSRFISLSGMSGILAGIYALIGAGIAYTIIYSPKGLFHQRALRMADYSAHPGQLLTLIAIAFSVLVLSLVCGLILTLRKAKRTGQQIWGKTSKMLLFNMALPLCTGGILILILLSRGYFGVVAPVSLIFYGLALTGASNFTFTDVKYLGITEIALGLLAALLPGFGLLFWAVGFGVAHIVYGIVMYLKYDR